MIKAATVSIVHDDSTTAGRETAEELLSELGAEPDLVLLFASANYDPACVLAGLTSRLSDRVKLAGCSSYAEINSEEALTHSVTAMGLKLDGVEYRTFKLDDVGTDSKAAGRAFASQIKDFEPSLLIIFPDGLKMEATPFLVGIQEILGRTFPIVGGVAADLGQFARTYEYFDREVISGGAVGVALKGNIEIVTAARSGWQPVGAPRRCTKVDRKAILEFDNQPAANLYKEYLGHRASEMPEVGVEFPLGLVGGGQGSHRLPQGEDILLVRAVIGVDEARQALLCVGDVPEGVDVRMMRAGKEDLIKGADEAGAMVVEAMPKPAAALFFDCMGRKLVLGARYKEELKKTFSLLGDDVPKIGFYTYGEISPVQGVTMYHDETFTVALLKA